LYMSSTSGDSWRFAALPLWEVSVFVYWLFLIYIAFFLFVVVNTLTSIIIEATMSNAAKERHEIIQDELKKKASYVSSFKELYSKLDDDGSGDVSMGELSKHLHDAEMLAFMQSLDLDASDIEQFFSALSINGELSVDVETFVVGCMKLKGSARSMDLLSLCHAHRRLAIHQRRWESRCIAEFAALRSSINNALQSALGGASAQEPVPQGSLAEIQAQARVLSNALGGSGNLQQSLVQSSKGRNCSLSIHIPEGYPKADAGLPRASTLKEGGVVLDMNAAGGHQPATENGCDEKMCALSISPGETPLGAANGGFEGTADQPSLPGMTSTPGAPSSKRTLGVL